MSAEVVSSGELSSRQAMVLRAVVGAYVGEAGPIGSPTLARLLPESISAASVRNTLAELTSLGLLRKPHRSAGSIPTERGLRCFVDELLDPQRLAGVERRELAGRLQEASSDSVMHVASQMLSERTQLLGFVVTPRLDGIVLRHLSLVRMSSERVLVIMISKAGVAHRRILADDGWGNQAELDQVASALNEWIPGRTLRDVREVLRREARALRSQAHRLRERAVRIGAQALASTSQDSSQLVVATRLAVLDRPELREDPTLVRRLLTAVETKEQLVKILDLMLEEEGVRVAFGEETDSTVLEDCAIIGAPYGDSERLGVVGVLGPSRMNYGRIIPLVDYLSELVTEKLQA